MEEVVDRCGCINLREQFGWQYKIAYEESYYAEHGEGSRREDPWLQDIPCKFGCLMPWGGECLGANVAGHPLIAGRLRRLVCSTVRQDGDFGELTVSFHVDDFDQVAKIMQPERGRRVSAGERQRLLEMGRKTRFIFKEHGLQGQRSVLEEPKAA